MAKLAKLLQAAAGAGGGAALNVEDVFSTHLVELTASTSYGAVTNNIDLSGEGGLVWEKARNITQVNRLYDTERGATKILKSDSTAAEVTASTSLTSFNSDGFTIDYSFYGSDTSECFWTFRKAPKFFDVVTYTGTGSAQTISHNLGSVPGCIIVKCTSNARDWYVYHRGSNGGTNPEQYKLNLNSTAAAATETDAWNDTAPTSSVFTVGSVSNVNASGFTYVAYLFAHNDGDGEFGDNADQDIIKCGSMTGTGSVMDIDLGFEPQWIMFKRTDASGSWEIFDNMRGMVVGGSSNSTAQRLEPNATDAEGTTSPFQGVPTPTGFRNESTFHYASGRKFIYIAIRRGPMAVPEDADDVFAIDTEGSSEPYYNSGFPVDFGLQKRHTASGDWYTMSRLTQGKFLETNTTNAEATEASAFFDYNDGFVSTTAYGSGNSYGWMWRRAPNYFDVVAVEGKTTSGNAQGTMSHNLGAVPEMIWGKCRNAGRDWQVYHKDLGPTKNLVLSSTAAAVTDSDFWGTTPTDSVFYAGSEMRNADDNIFYLFASLDGVSKVGSYTGDGTTDGSNVVDCGFTNGARFILVKMADGTSNWGVFDTERGIVSGNDPRLFLDTTAAQLTTVDFLVPNSSGFAFINGFNSNGFTYIFYAIAA